MILSSWIGYSFLILVRRRFDFFTLSWVGFSFYYSAMIVNGFTLRLDDAGSLLNTYDIQALDSRLEISLCIFVLASVFFVMAYDLMFRRRNCSGDSFLIAAKHIFSRIELVNIRTLVWITMILTFVFIFISFLRSGFNLNYSKAEFNLLSGTYITLATYFFGLYSFFAIIWIYSSSRFICFYSLVWLLMFSVFLFVFNQRIAAVMPLLLLVSFVFLRIGYIPARYFFVGVLLFPLFGFVLLWGGNGSVFRVLDFDVNSMLISLEGYYVSSVLNQLFHSGFHIDYSYLFYAPLMVVPYIRNILSPYGTQYYHDFYVAMVFPQAQHGMAYNPIGEAYFTFGYYGVLIFSVVVNFNAMIFSYFVRNSGLMLSFLILFLSPYFFIFIHRSSLFFLLSFFSNTVLLFSFVVLLYSFFISLRKR